MELKGFATFLWLGSLYCPYCLRLQWIFDIIIIIFPKITLSDVSSLRCHIVSIILSPHCFIIIVCCKNSHSTPDCPIPQFQLLCKEMEQFWGTTINYNTIFDRFCHIVNFLPNFINKNLTLLFCVVSSDSIVTFRLTLPYHVIYECSLTKNERASDCIKWKENPLNLQLFILNSKNIVV